MDHTSFQDLDIFGPDNSTAFFKQFDSTITTGGRVALRTRMANPFTDAAAIDATQQTLQCLKDRYAWWAAQFSEQQLVYVEKYINSRIIPFVYHNTWRARWQAYRFRKKYKQDWYFLHTALLHFCALLHNLRKLFETLDEVPVPLQRMQQLLRSLQDPKGFVAGFDVKKARTYTTPIIVFLDSFFREQGKTRCLELIDAFFELDALFSMTHAEQKWELKAPEIGTQEPTICFEGLYHPLVDAATANDFCFHDREHLLFLTGPNMAGKSTFLKAIGIAVYLGHLGMGVPAASARMPVFDTLFVHINISDDIVSGNSYFQSEINRVNELAACLKKSKRAFVVIDELFRGTNRTDAADCAALVIDRLTAWTESCFVLSSHSRVLAERISGYPEIRFMRFCAKIVANQPVFGYRLEEGVSTIRLGKILLQNAGTLEKLQPGAAGV